MSGMFLRVTVDGGEQLVSEFTKLANVQRYATQVMMGAKPFNAWRVVGDTHPHSGERNIQRTRVLVSGRIVRQVEHVERKPDAAPDSMAPNDFVPVVESQFGEQGMWTAPSEPDPLVEGAVPGVRYPVHVDPRDLQRYVILRAAGFGGPDVSEIRYYIQRDTTTDAAPVPGMSSTEVFRPGDGDEDISDEDFAG